jgi:NADH-quinone oxidoreductase subunit L
MLYQLIVFLPAGGALLAGLFGRWLTHRGAEVVTCTFMVTAAFLSCIAFYRVTVLGLAPVEPVTIFRWFDAGAFEADWALRIDTLTAVMLVVVNGVSALIHIYSIGYMSHDPHRARFFAYLSMFTFAMLMLVTADNFMQLFFGWEGVGLTSYLLIGFWYTRPSANAAAIKAFIVNRVGDFGFALGIMAIFLVFGSVDFDTVFEMAPEVAGQTFDFLGFNFDVLTTICLLLFLGAMGKSAQFLLHTWLPDAMEGPTPVSALIHAATMVTAGVFLVCRCSFLFEYAPDALAVVTVVGAITAFFAASVGLVQNDIKRVVAYSTCSQLGYMFFAAGVGAYQVAMFHLFTHAFFKALLFLGAGSVIHALSDEQDMRNMGGLYRVLPWTMVVMLLATISITGIGIPHTIIGFSGFVSKDAIIETAYAVHTPVGTFAFWMGLTAAAMTSFYSWRVFFMTFFGKARASMETMSHAHESPPIMLIPLVILAIGAVFAGIFFYSSFIGSGHEEFWKNSIFTVGELSALDLREDVHETWVFYAPLVMTFGGLGWAWLWYVRQPHLPARFVQEDGLLYQFLLNKWYFDEFYDFLFVEPAKRLGRFLWKQGDGWLIDGFGPNGVASTVLETTRRVVRLQTGYVYHYAFAMLIGIALLVSFYYARAIGVIQ